MPRPRQFDSDVALDAMMHVFWRKGFAETSYDDLVEASRVGRKSLYATYGDKQALFVKALKRYRTGQARRFLDALDEPGIDLDGVKGVVRQIAKLSSSEAGRWGCLMANTAVDETVTLPEVRDELDRHLAGIADRFAAALLRAGMAPERIRSTSYHLTGVLQGLFVLAHARADAAMIDAYAAGSLEAVR